MTAIRISVNTSAAVVAAQAYWANHEAPNVLRDLAQHLCIDRRHGPGRGIGRWHFARDQEHLEIVSAGPLIINSEPVIRQAALDGIGIAMLAKDDVSGDIAAGQLQRVLQDGCPPMFGYFLYHPSQRLQSASLKALIDTLRVG